MRISSSLAIESAFVGIYCGFLFLGIQLFVRNQYLLLFAFGFCKHLLGAYLGLQTYYCNHGQACKSLDSANYIYKKDTILQESVLEGLWFLVFGIFAFEAFSTLNMRVIAIFGIGFTTHLLSEYIGLHHSICENRCVKQA